MKIEINALPVSELTHYINDLMAGKACCCRAFVSSLCSQGLCKSKFVPVSENPTFKGDDKRQGKVACS